MKSAILGFLLLAASVPASADIMKYGITTSVDKHADFTKLKTYAWSPGWASFYEPIDERIVSAVDRELTRRGLIQVPENEADTIVTYAAVQRTDVDTETRLPGYLRHYREYAVGTLAIRLMPASFNVREVFRDQHLFLVKADARLAGDPASIERQIDDLVAEMFLKFPVDSNGASLATTTTTTTTTARHSAHAM